MKPTSAGCVSEYGVVGAFRRRISTSRISSASQTQPRRRAEGQAVAIAAPELAPNTRRKPPNSGRNGPTCSWFSASAGRVEDHQDVQDEDGKPASRWPRTPSSQRCVSPEPSSPGIGLKCEAQTAGTKVSEPACRDVPCGARDRSTKNSKKEPLRASWRGPASRVGAMSWKRTRHTLEAAPATHVAGPVARGPGR